MCGRYTITNPNGIYADCGVEPDERVLPRYNVSLT